MMSVPSGTVGRVSGRVTLDDVAKAAGVSQATASRALNGGPDAHVRARMRERVVAAAATLGYFPNEAARATATGTAALVGLVVSTLATADDVYAGVARVAADAGLTTVSMMFDDGDGSLLDQLRRLQRQQVSAVVVIADCDVAAPEIAVGLSALVESGAGVCVVGCPVEGFSCVEGASSAGTEKLAGHAVGRGFRRPLLLAGDLASRPERGVRVDAFRRVFDECGCLVDDTAVIANVSSFAEVYTATLGALQSGAGFDIVFVADDELMGAVTSAVRDAGPEHRDVGVAAYVVGDRVTWDESRVVATVRADRVGAGRDAAELALAGRGTGRVVRRREQARLVVGVANGPFADAAIC